ncbi:tetratricopeptide repeat protein [Duganella vulcania]|uniref:Sel1 repeat family protein n=1 Tax=Duganella vulcania TaxID=2692166 RepID=A0A845GVK9_9BURK|nr:tetratricopeptide repeat protein [Duganella vulcania]MYM97400.1 sel1 repeat family protein [Duganella vulcania]
MSIASMNVLNKIRPYALALLSFGTLLVVESSSASAKEVTPIQLEKFSLAAPPTPCVREKDHMPSTRDPVAYQLFNEARKIWRSKPWGQLTEQQEDRIFDDTRKAAALGDWEARVLLAELYTRGLENKKRNSPRSLGEISKEIELAHTKVVDLARTAADAGQPWGWYSLAVAYENGYGNLVKNTDKAMAYYLYAAKLGSPEAQMALADTYFKTQQWQNETALRRCAYQQGHGPAAYILGLRAGYDKRYAEALQIYQQGVKFGSGACARALNAVFQQGAWGWNFEEEFKGLKALGIHMDREREKRYESIYEALEINPDLRFSKLDLLLPLPPSKLPAWPGVNNLADVVPDDHPTY